MTIKSWFLLKNFNANERMIIEYAQAAEELTAVKESEKAIQFRAESDLGDLMFWCPKSCILKDGEIDEDMERLAKAAEKGLSYNEKLVELGKENNIKGIRIGMKTKTLVQKLSNAGIEIPER